MSAQGRPLIAVTGVGVIAPTGASERAFAAGLATSRSAVVRGEDGFLTAPVGDFEPRRFIQAASLRRLPRLVQMTIVAARHALCDAARVDLGPPGSPLPDAARAPAAALGLDLDRVGVILGTGLGTFEQTMEFLNGYIDGGPEAASPLLFPTSVMNAAAGLLAVDCAVRGVNSTINHKDASPLLALGMAIDQLSLGRADAILAGAIDELCPSTLEGYRLLGGLATDAMRPYDRAHGGLALGESAALLVLERLDDARARGRRVRAILGPRAETSEGRPRVGWGEGLAGAEAVRAVAEAAETTADLDWIAGGGNGTRLDDMELGACARAFQALGRPLPPVSSILSQTGESAASAMLRVCAAVVACEEGLVPGTLGLEQAIDGYDAAIVRAPRRQPVRAALVPSFAQGGANAALVVRRA